MAKDEKTEKATPKRVKEARKKGQVSKSTDLNGALVLGGGVIALSSFGPAVVNGAAGAMQTSFELISRPNEVASAAGLNGLVHLVLNTMLTTVAPIAGICLGVGLLANVMQVGFRPSFHVLKPDFKKLNPATGAKNLFGPRIFFETGKALTKVTVVGAVVAMALVPQITALGASIGTTPVALGGLVSAGVKGIMERAVIAYLMIGIVDLIWQRHRHTKQMKMTKQEVGDEFKQTQLPPEVKSALRRRALLASRARMMAAIPQADVVVTNPTHYAVALSYDGNHPAPIVVAKGKDFIAAQIRRIAEENDVPIVPDPQLARSLFGSVEIDQMIPVELYAAVAQVLAFVYRLAGRKKASS
jgi:flagellar biosynthetic protein FlhB